MTRVSFLILLEAFLLFRFDVCYAQEKGFLATYSEENHSWFVTDALETSNGSFVICAYDYWGNESMLLKLLPNGEIIAKTSITAEDTTIYARRCLLVPGEGCQEVVVLCPCHPNDGSTPALLYIRVDEDLNIVSRKTIPCCFFEPGSRFYETKFIREDSHVYGTLTSRLSSTPNAVFLTQFDIDGNLLNCQRYERDSINSVCNLYHAGEGKVGLFGSFNTSHMGFLTFDSSLQLIGRDTIFHWSKPEGNNGVFCHYAIYDLINSHAVVLPDGSYVVSSRLLESLHYANGPSYANDRSVILAKYENGFHQPENMLVTEHMNDSLEYPAFFRSMDFKEIVNEGCNVFQCSILNELPQYGFLQQPYPTGIVVTKTDQDLNIEWKKRFLRDGNYQAMVINATSDGGCLVVGSLGDFQAQRFDVFALKINADGTVGLDEIQEEDMAFVYPNPAKETIRIGGMEAKETQVYNALGQCVMNFRGNEASVVALTTGTYVLRVTDIDNKNHTLRVVVVVVDK